MLFADSFSVTGCHGVCKDYAYTQIFEYEGKQYALAVLSDGCTSAKHSDLGSRILCHSLILCIAKFFLRGLYQPKDCFEDIVSRASKVCNDLGLSYDCLDATILGCITDGKTVYIIAWGDGYISTPKLDYRVEFECNAPFYISYLISKQRLKAYEQQYGGEKAWIHIRAKELGLQNESISLNPISQPTLFAHLIAPLDSDFSICLASDGITSFSIEQDNKASESLPADKIVSDFMAYKNFQGEFVQRRVTKVLKEYNKLNIRHFDDLSFATIHFSKDSNEATSVHTENGSDHPN
jgi:hypothetical protein